MEQEYLRASSDSCRKPEATGEGGGGPHTPGPQEPGKPHTKKTLKNHIEGLKRQDRD